MQSSTSLPSLHLSSRILTPRRARPSVVYAGTRDFSGDNRRNRFNGKLVDENMIVLRMRIQEIMKEDEENYGKKWEKWADWEREWCKNYESDVFEIVGTLQMLLLNIRPSLAIGMMAFLAFSVCRSLAVTVYFLLHFVMGIDTLMH